MLRIAPTLAVLVSLASSGCIGVSQSAGKAADKPVEFKAHASLKVCKNGVRIAKDGLLDDFEDGNTQLSQLEGRNGYWWKAHDPDGSTIGPDDSTPRPEGVDGSLAFYVTGQTASADAAWGVNFGANFVNDKTLYDASKYAGITFKAKAGANSTKKVRFKIGDVNTHQDLGICTECWNHFGQDLTLTEDWKQYAILFSEVRQLPGWGDPRPGSVTPAELYSFDISIGKSTTFEVWLDDVALLECK
jgi:endoglucanase